MLTHPDALPEGDRIQLKVVLANCPELTALAEHVRSFACMVTELQGQRLPEWIEAARAAADLPSLSRFAQHLERDLDAVIAGLTQSWNSGVVEGHVNRIKMLKRQRFGRAGSELMDLLGSMAAEETDPSRCEFLEGFPEGFGLAEEGS
ncbi:transposase [Streptomyces sp. KN37]|uniref:transposase n=1 Tax=Streptomyces sp. KN37 TaxID=3090667 RepID=UPI0039BE5E26